MSLPHKGIPTTGTTDGTVRDPANDGRIVILFDGVCDVCNSGVSWIEMRDRVGAFTFLPFQSPDVPRRWPGLDPRELARALHAVAPDGSVRTGADALPLILAHLPGRGPRLAVRLLALPGALALARPLYGLFARLRPRRATACLTNHGQQD